MTIFIGSAAAVVVLVAVGPGDIALGAKPVRGRPGADSADSRNGSNGRSVGRRGKSGADGERGKQGKNGSAGRVQPRGRRNLTSIPDAPEPPNVDLSNPDLTRAEARRIEREIERALAADNI